jgi:hypothetical protein
VHFLEGKTENNSLKAVSTKLKGRIKGSSVQTIGESQLRV